MHVIFSAVSDQFMQDVSTKRTLCHPKQFGFGRISEADGDLISPAYSEEGVLSFGFLYRLRTISQSYFCEGFGPRGAIYSTCFHGSPTSFEEIGALILTIHSQAYEYPIT